MKPNVIVIHADQHRQEALGAYGNPDIRTPNLDALAADGVLHRSHYCCYPICTPSRYSLLCGMYPSSHMGIGNHSTLPPGLPTFASLLRGAGYRTAAVGKMHFTPTYLDVGFDTMVLAEQDGDGRFDDDYHRYLRDLGLLDEIDLYDQRSEYRKNAPASYWDCYGAQRSDLPLEHHSTTYITDRALEQIGQFDPQGGNLLMVGYIKPHHPLDPPEPYSSMYDPDSLSMLPGYTDETCAFDRVHKGYFDYSGMTQAQARRAMAHYYGSVSHIDAGVGQIIAQLKERGMYDNSLILYTSDHGDYLGYHHLLLKGGHMYDPVARIPLILKYPLSWRKRGVDDTLSSNIDVARTILSVCGVEAAPSMVGLDLTRDVQGREFVVCEQFRASRGYMIRTKTHKLLLEEPDAPHLFDLTLDPCELCDRAADPAYGDILRELKEMLATELLFMPNFSYCWEEAPLAAGQDLEEIAAQREVLRAYMREKSSVKPVL